MKDLEEVRVLPSLWISKHIGDGAAAGYQTFKDLAPNKDIYIYIYMMCIGVCVYIYI